MVDVIGGSVVWNLDVDDDKLSAGLTEAKNKIGSIAKEADKTFSDMAKSISSSFASIGKSLATKVTLPLAAMGTLAVREAALSEGAMDKFRVVFGEFANDMDSFITDIRTRMPVPRREIVALASGVQDLLVPMGIAREEASGMTKEMLELANQIAVFNDVSPTRVLEAMKSGLVGSSEPLRAFGVDARVAALEMVALEEGLIAAGEKFSELDPKTLAQIQSQALLAQITRQSSDAIAGYEENLDAAIPRFQDLTATFKDVAAEVGGVMLPILDSLLKEHILPLVRGFQGMDEETKKNIVQYGLIAAAIGPVLIIASTLINSLFVISTAARLVSTGLILATSSVGKFAIALFTRAIPAAARFVLSLVSGIIPALTTVATTIFSTVIPAIVALVIANGPLIAGILTVIAVVALLKKAWDSNFLGIRDITKKVIDSVIGFFKSLPGAIESIINKVRGFLDKINPFHRESPSLVDNVISGVKKIKEEYASIQGIALPSLSGASPDVSLGSDFSSSSVDFDGSIGGGVKQEITIEIGQVNSQEDIESLTRELGFMASVAPQLAL